MDKTDKDILAESDERSKQKLQLNLINLVETAVIGATEALEAMRLVACNEEAPFDDRYRASTFLANKIVPERVPVEGAGVPDVNIEKLLELFASKIEDQI